MSALNPKKQKGGKRLSFIKSWFPRINVSLVLSVLAFTIVAIQSYGTVLRKVDSVSMVFYGDPPAFLGGDKNSKDKISWRKSVMTMVLINSGNRPAVITEIYMYALQQPPSGNEQCSDDLAIEQIGPLFKTDFKPTVIKAQDVITKDIQIVGSKYGDEPIISEKENGNLLEFDARKTAVVNNEIKIDICIEANLTTTSAVLVSKDVSGIRYTMGKNAGIFDSRILRNNGQKLPQVLYQHSAWFWED